MPLYEIQPSKALIPFRQLRGGADLYESEIETLLWDSIEEFTGEGLFRVARQANIEGGGRPDVVALDRTGRVVVIEIKRDVDRGQLAQCLEYAGWARATSLDELQAMYHDGPDRFFRDWQDFTDSPAPIPVRRAPRLILVARDFHGRTSSAFEFLVEHRLPVKLVRVSIYEDQDGRRFLDVEGEHEPDFPTDSEAQPRAVEVDATTVDGRPIRLQDLLDSGLIAAGQRLTWDRPRLGRTYHAQVEENGSLQIEDGRSFSSPSGAAMAAANVASCDGWYAWRTEDPARKRLHDLRVVLVERIREPDGEAASDG